MVASSLMLATLEWTLDWGLGARLLVAGVALLVLALSWWNLRPLDDLRKRALLLALRVALLSLLFVVFLEPTWVEERQRSGSRLSSTTPPPWPIAGARSAAGNAP